MPLRLLQINTVANQGSTGRIAEQIGMLAGSHGWDSTIAYGRGNPQSASRLLRIGSTLDMVMHGIHTRLTDRHGLASRRVTREFIRTVERDIRPDIVHLHNIHGYYLNYPALFEWLKEWGGPVVWTLHDLWPLTGHCAFFGREECDGWKNGCMKCHRVSSYPASMRSGATAANHRSKMQAFTSLKNLTLVPCSHWLDSLLKESPLGCHRSVVIHNGIDLNTFRPDPNGTDIAHPYVLGVANVWEPRKGLEDFIKLRETLPAEIGIRLVGLTEKQIKSLPSGIIGLQRTANPAELARLYSNAICLVNPTWDDNYPTVNLEAIACGTPVVTYRTGGSPESIDSDTGLVVERGDIRGLADAVSRFMEHPADQALLRSYAEEHFDSAKAFRRYIQLYNSLLQSTT